MECTIVIPELFGNFQQALPAKATKDLKQSETQESKIEFGIEKIRECILKVDKGAFKLKDISKSTMKLSNQFTYRHYINRIEEEIINV